MNIKKVREELRNGKTIYDIPLNVGYYARVSTDKSDQLNSLLNQQHYFEELINNNVNWHFIGGFIDEGISGTSIKHRSQFLLMIELSSRGEIDLILTKEISRFSRNTMDSIKYTECLLKQGTAVYFLSDNLNTIQEDAEFRLTIMSSLAQDEVRKLSERVKFGINRMIKERKLIGSNLTGYYKKNGMYMINEKEVPIIKYLFETYASGNIGLKQIGIDLFKMGYANKKCGVYSQTTLAKMLINPRYKGYYTARLSEVENYKTHKKIKVLKENQIIEKDEKIPLIISEELWNKANDLYNMRKNRYAYHVLNREEFLNNSKYSCKLYCYECNNIFIRSGGSNRRNNPIWACKKYKIEGVKKCASPIIKERLLDKVFINLLTKIINIDKDEIIKEYNNILIKDSNINKEIIKNKIIALKNKQDRLLELKLENLINNLEFENKNNLLRKEIEKMIENLENYKFNNNNSQLDEIRKNIENSLNIKDNLSTFINIFIEKIIVKKINNSRKNIELIIYFNFKKDSIKLNLNLY